MTRAIIKKHRVGSMLARCWIAYEWMRCSIITKDRDSILILSCITRSLRNWILPSINKYLEESFRRWALIWEYNKYKFNYILINNVYNLSAIYWDYLSIIFCLRVIIMNLSININKIILLTMLMENFKNHGLFFKSNRLMNLLT